MPDTDVVIKVTFRKEEQALRRAARALDHLYLLAGGGRGRYETSTNAYEDALASAYAAWIKQLAKALASTPREDQRAQIAEALAELQRTLQGLGQETLPDALYTLGHDYVPSADAFFMIADAIRQNNLTIATRLLPDLQDKLERALDEEADPAAVAESLASRVTGLAGVYWSTIQRSIGDFAAQAQTADDEIYECRWVLEPRAEHCEACTEFAGTYDSYNAMLQVTRECVPGYFFGYRGRACWSNCRCHLELKINGNWTRV